MNENKELLEEIKQYIERANNLIQDVVEKIREQKGTEDFTNLIEGIAYCLDGLYGLYNIELKNITVEIINEYRENFNKNTKDMMEALENKDINLLADILEYEVIDLLSNLNNDIKNVNLM